MKLWLDNVEIISTRVHSVEFDRKLGLFVTYFKDGGISFSQSATFQPKPGKQIVRVVTDEFIDFEER